VHWRTGPPLQVRLDDLLDTLWPHSRGWKADSWRAIYAIYPATGY